MPKFRFLGATVLGETTDERGIVLPNVVRATSVYGFDFNYDDWTEVPEDAVAYECDVLDRSLGRTVRRTVYAVDKLRGNSEFEEHNEEAPKTRRKSA